MYLCVKQYQIHYYQKYLRANHVHIDREVFNDRVEDMTTFVINRYLTDTYFWIDRLSAYAYFGFKKINATEAEKDIVTDSYEQILESCGDSLSYIQEF